MKKLFLSLAAITLAVGTLSAANPTLTPLAYKPNSWQLKSSQGYTKLVSKYKTVTLLFLGDSITHGWTMTWVKHNGSKVWNNEFKKYPSRLNIGLSGDKIQNILWRITEGKQLDYAKPSMIILMIGANNLGKNSNQNDNADGIKKIIETIQTKQPQAKILLLSVLPVSWRMTQYAELNKIICKFHDGKKVFFLDVASCFLKPDGKPQYLHDGLHPTEEGYRAMAKKMIPEIDRILAIIKAEKNAK